MNLENIIPIIAFLLGYMVHRFICNFEEYMRKTNEDK